MAFDLDKELKRRGYRPSKKLREDLKKDVEKTGGRVYRTQCRSCGVMTINGRCPNCGEKWD